MAIYVGKELHKGSTGALYNFDVWSLSNGNTVSFNWNQVTYPICLLGIFTSATAVGTTITHDFPSGKITVKKYSGSAIHVTWYNSGGTQIANQVLSVSYSGGAIIGVFGIVYYTATNEPGMMATPVIITNAQSPAAYTDVSAASVTDNTPYYLNNPVNRSVSLTISGWPDAYAILGPIYVPPTDPYGNLPPAGPGGGGGTGNFVDSDTVDFPANPGVSAVNSGFISLWSPTEQQMLSLSSYMWNADAFTIEFWKKLWADPLEVIYGLNIIPVNLRATGRDIIGGTESVIVGLVNTNVEMDYLKEQWIELDCGSISLAEAWGAYLDYDPYTKLEIYLPYCGIHPLRVDDFMNGTISLKYKIDLLSGACVALIKADRPNDDENDLSGIVYQFMGNCATQIPVTASQFADAVRSVISLAASVGTMLATGGGGAAAAAAGTASAASKAALAERTIHNSAAVVENVMGIKPGIERSGAIGAAAGLLGVQTPYLIITRPRQAHPTDQNKFTGYPSFITETLGDLEGWTVVKDIHLENIPCTADELAEIDGLLKSGVIF